MDPLRFITLQRLCFLLECNNLVRNLHTAQGKFIVDLLACDLCKLLLFQDDFRRYGADFWRCGVSRNAQRTQRDECGNKKFIHNYLIGWRRGGQRLRELNF